MLSNPIIIKRKLREFLEEDCHFQDVSSAFIPEKAKAEAKIIAKSKGFISGLEELAILYSMMNLPITIRKKDGDEVEKGEIVAEIDGNIRKILFIERVGLNILTHMSAITTSTRKLVGKVEEMGKNVKIACTRKTNPGLRFFEKKAVEIGGGDTHRFSLDDMILLKDTHLRFYNGDVEKLLLDVKEKASFSKKIEIEVEKVEDVVKAAKNGADIIMLDNMSPVEVSESIDSLIKTDLRDKVVIEVSGGITEKNIGQYIEKEPDIISTSEITQFPSEKVDLSLRFI